ncbi:hypothetical protein [Candidatus Electrothrix sp.]|uniref:hypothetical protein n=1 Tax=Candidatus Electrothrix sp. TaxID=2170559 RepID=UPI00405685E7
MYFDYSDLVQFRLNKKEKTIQCTSSFLKPVHIVMMSILHNYTDYTVGFQYHADYAEAMRFDDPLEVDTVDGSYHRKAIKLQDQFVDDSQMKKIMDILYDNNYLDYGTNDILQLVIAEIFQNFYAHADVEEPPICCVQDWPSSDFLEISLADNGIGINNALRDYLRDYPDSINPCRMACNLGVSSCLEGKGKLGTNHSGYGLYYTKRFGSSQISGERHVPQIL